MIVKAYYAPVGNTLHRVLILTVCSVTEPTESAKYKPVLKSSLGHNFLPWLKDSIVKHTCLEKMVYSAIETTCFGLYLPSSGFYNIKKEV